MLVFDCTGDKGSMEAAIQLLQQGGTLVFVGLINDTVSLFDPDLHPARSDHTGEPQQHSR